MSLSFSYDIEVFPNFFCATFLNTENHSDKYIFVISNNCDNSKKLLKFLETEMVLYGFNNIMYDGAVLHYILKNYKDNPQIKPSSITNDLYNFSVNIISYGDRMNFDSETRNHQYPTDVKYKQIDLMKINAYDKLGVSLKQISINLKWHKIQDLPLPYDHIVTKEEETLVVEYNLNDVLITEELRKSLSSQLELRTKLSEEYGVDLMSASDSKMANVILEDIYCKEVGVTPKDIRNLRTKRETILISDCLGKNIEFKTNTLKRIKREIESKILYQEDNYKYNKTVKFAGVEYELGVGGLHSVDTPGIFLSDKNYKIQDNDVASFYPNIMILNKLYPEHLSPKFVDVLEGITIERIHAKKSGDKIKADSLKITVNSIFGKLGSDTFWLYDPAKLISVTVSGQLYLLMLIESLVLAGIEVISANTDGVVSLIPLNKEDQCKQILKEWQEKTGFELESTDYKAYYRSDVNNYLVQKPDGKTKEKGRYLKDIDLKKAYKHPIVPKALYEYYIHSKPVLDTLQASNDILEFCVSQKVGGDFVLEYREEGKTNLPLQKNNRFFISCNGGSLVKKRQSNDGEIGLYVGKLTTVLNDYDPTIPFSSYSIDYDFYAEEANKYIAEIDKIGNLNNGHLFNFRDEPEDYIDLEDVYQNKKNIISSQLKGIKGLPDRIIENLLHIKEEFQGDEFLDLLIYCEENSLMSTKYRELIKLNWFSRYGKAKKLICIFEEFTKGKSKYTKTLAQKTKDKRIQELKVVCAFSKDENFTVKEQIANEIEICGTIKSKFEVNDRYCFIQNVDCKYSSKTIEVQFLHTGKKQTFRVAGKVFDEHPLKNNDIILMKEFKKKNKKRKNENGEWEDVLDKFDWWCETYYIVKETDALKP
jgi:hypothetical protein